MHKKGMELATSTIIMVVLGLIVLTIIVLIFRQQATKGSQGYDQYTKQTDVNSLSTCSNIILGRSCQPNACSTYPGLQTAPGAFSDCQAPKNCCQGA